MKLPEAQPDCDEELLRKIADGDAGAFHELFTRYGDRAYQVAVAVCDDYELAEGAVRDAFLTCWKTSTTYAQRGSVPAWLLTTVRQQAVEAARRRALARRASPVVADAEREVVELAYFGRLTQAEIAAQLALAPTTTARHMRLGLSKLPARPEVSMSEAR